MRKTMPLAGAALVAGLVLLFARSAQTAPAEDAALKLWDSLSAEQKQLAQLPLKDKERYREDFPAVQRPGLPFTKLTKEQKELVAAAVAAMTSKYGAERAAKVAKETPDDRRYLTFYGTPEKGKAFAWRIAQHHLTLIYAEFGGDAPDEFGPVLLGGNPVGEMWDEEDQLFLKLYAALSAEERKKTSGKGIKVGDLTEQPRDLARQLLAKRLDVFDPNYRKNFDAQLKSDGGVDGLTLVINAKDATKSHRKGGRYNWRFVGGRVLCDWQTVDNQHLHLTLRAAPQKKEKA